MFRYTAKISRAAFKVYSPRKVLLIQTWLSSRSIRKTPTIEVDQAIKISVLRSHFINHVKGYSRYYVILYHIIKEYRVRIGNPRINFVFSQITLSNFLLNSQIKIFQLSRNRLQKKKKKNYLMFRERHVRMCVINLPQNSTFIFSYPSQLRCFTQFSSFSFHSFSVALNLTCINMISLKL